MKHILFEAMGDEYPSSLQQKYPHVINRLIALWNNPNIDTYFTSLLVDTRGGRKGFDDDAFKDIHRLYKFHEIERLRLTEGKFDAIKELERLGIKFNVFEFRNVVNQGNQKLLDLFIRGGINVNAFSDGEESCLQIALKNGFTVIANILLKAGANADIKDVFGLTPLQVACGRRTQGYRELVEQLVMMGADVNVRDQKGWTPLMVAISTGDEDLVALLLKNGANPLLKTPKGDDALALAQKFGLEEVIELITNTNQRLRDLMR